MTIEGLKYIISHSEGTEIEYKKSQTGLDFYVPESSQAHCHKWVYYDRNQDGDFALKNAQQIADLILRKQTGCTENRVLPYLTMDDLELELFDDVRKRVRLNRENHLWSTMTNEEILESAGMKLKDPSTGKEGYTLAAALLFGKERTLTSVVPFYRIDALCRKNNTSLYDDRDVIHCNLFRAYERLMEFCRRHLPEWPYIEGTQRLSIRELVMRENCLNLLIHREYGARHEASLTIWKDRVETRNWNIPFGYGQITLDNLRPHAKNPTIANFFAQLGIVEELGNGMRTMFKYVPMISGGANPMIKEEDEFTVCIPFVSDKTTNKTTNITDGDFLKDFLKDFPKDRHVELSDRQAYILYVISNDASLSGKDISQKISELTSGNISVTDRTIRTDIADLQAKGILTREGGRKDGRWVITQS